MTVSHKVSCQLYLLLQLREAIRDGSANGLHLEPNTRETLGQCVMYLVRQSLTFFQNSLEFPAFYAVEDAKGKKRQH